MRMSAGHELDLVAGVEHNACALLAERQQMYGESISWNSAYDAWHVAADSLDSAIPLLAREEYAAEFASRTALI